MIRAAREPVPYGAPVEADCEQCWPTADLTRMAGIARRAGRTERGYEQGEAVSIRTDGGIRAELLAPAEITINGLVRRLLVGEIHYFELRGGRIVG